MATGGECRFTVVMHPTYCPACVRSAAEEPSRELSSAALAVGGVVHAAWSGFRRTICGIEFPSGLVSIGSMVQP